MKITSVFSLKCYHKVASLRGASDERQLRRALFEKYGVNVDAFKNYVKVTNKDGLVGLIPFPFESERWQSKLDTFI